MAAGLVVALSLFGAAWACTALPSVSVAPGSGASGTKVVVNGNGFSSGIPVEIRWGGPDGPLAGIAETGDFSLSILPPADAGTGVLYLVGIQKNPAGATIAKAAGVFELTGPSYEPGSKTSISADLWPGFAASRLLDGESLYARPHTSSSPFMAALGAGLLSFGLVAAMTAGMAAIVFRRRAGSI